MFVWRQRNILICTLRTIFVHLELLLNIIYNYDIGENHDFTHTISNSNRKGC